MSVPDNGPVIVGISWWLCFFCGGFLGLRLYAKLSRKQGLWWDDYILILSWVMLLIQTTITQMGKLLGFGKHAADIPIQNLTTIALYISIGASISCFHSTFSKISFGVTLLRLVDGPMRWFVWFCIITLFIVMIPSALLGWLQCTPTEKAWNSSIEGTCWDGRVIVDYGIFNAAWCTWIDFAIAMVPWKLLWRLQLRRREKVGVGIAMSMGVLAGICAIIKGIYMVQLREQDFFYNGIDVTIWTSVETATAIIGASIPVLRVFIKETISTYNSGSNDVHLSRMRRSQRFDHGGKPVSTPRRNDVILSVETIEDSASDRSIERDDEISVAVNENMGVLQTSIVTVTIEEERTEQCQV